MRQNPDDRPLDDYGLDDEYEDDDPTNPTHRDHAIWLGDKVELDLAALK